MGCRADAQPVDRLAIVMRMTSFVLKDIGHPEYSSEKSKRTFSDHAKIGLLVVRQFLEKSYEDFIDILPSLEGVMGAAGISKIPDPSTLWKFAARLEPEFLEDLMQKIASMVCADDMVVAVDSTGFSLTNISRHMEKRVKGSDVRRKRKDFVKTTYSVDTDSLMILSCDCTDQHSHDSKRMEHAVTSPVRGRFDVGYVVADKGYDAEHIHVDIHTRLNAEAFIPVRKMTEPARSGSSEFRTRGFNRGRMKCFFDKGIYGLRSLVETVNSMVKRKMGDVVNSRTPLTSNIEVLFRSIAHNFRRLFELGPDMIGGMIS